MEVVSRSGAEIVAVLALEEKVRLLSGRDVWHLEPVEAAGLDGVMVADGPHGLRKPLSAGVAAPATCFPTAAGRGATWDEALLHEVGAAIGRECRAEGVAVLLGPGLNLKRHPAGGRCFEYFSEDPLLSGRLAAAFTRGVQSQGVGACLKHFAVNSQETFRMTVDALVDERTLRELYLTGFEIAVEQGRPWTVMSSYNQVNGAYVGESGSLLTGILRDEWGFDGVVMSDWGATNDRAAGVEAGMDLEMPGSGGARDPEILAAVAAGTLTEDAVARAAARVVDLLLRGQSGEGDVEWDAEDHHALARRAAADATVLLTNDGILPLRSPDAVAVVGAFAEIPRYQGAGSSRVTPTRLDNALQALRGRLDAAIAYAPGYDAGSGATTDALLEEAIGVARGAEVVVVFAGLPSTYESEGLDRPHLRLPDGHTRLVEAVIEANPRTVVVLANGAPVELPWADRPAALVEAYLGGQAGGAALADVLLGDAEPGGRLAESFPVAAEDLAADRSFPGHPRQVEHREGLYVGYRFHDTAGVPARFPFGHGLSYTTFSYDGVEVAGAGQRFEVSVTVTNTGTRPGAEVVQVYVRDLEATVHRPDKELRGFAKLRLDPGETRTVTVALEPRAFSLWDVASKGWVVEAGIFEVLVGPSSADIRCGARIEVQGDARLQPEAAPPGFVADDAAFASMLGRAVPRPMPGRPFHRNSTGHDLRETALGRLTRAVLVRQMRRRLDGGLNELTDDPAALTRAMVEQLPLRAVVSLSGGRVSFAVIDGLVDALNNRWIRVLRRLLRR